MNAEENVIPEILQVVQGDPVPQAEGMFASEQNCSDAAYQVAMNFVLFLVQGSVWISKIIVL